MIDRGLLLADCRGMVKRLVEDLRGRAGDVAEVREVVKAEHSRAQVAGRTQRALDDWAEDLYAQVAVAWVLAGVFVRFCEDTGLIATPLLSGPGERRDLAQEHRSAWFVEHPAAGDREWIEEVVRRTRDLPGLGELFGTRNPLWLFGPSADRARDLLELWWRLDDAGTGLRHDFTDPTFDTRFLGDLYQDLSEHAKKQYALLQTPVFVEEFILDRTLEPALAEFGPEGFRMIDPACGSGHFLLGAFARLVERWREREPATPARVLVQRALDAVTGVDVNPFAVSVTRFRLLVAALRASEVARLADAPAFRLRVAVGDSLLHGTHPGRLGRASEFEDRTLRHRYPTEDGALANELLEAGTYDAVVGNPPYITVKDPALNTAYRSLYGSCHRQYSLGVPFTERCFQLARPALAGTGAGYVGMITTNSFMKREFGTKLIQELLPTLDLTTVVDTSGAYIPGHGTPTVLLFGRNQRPMMDTLRVVLGIRGEPGRPDDPAKAHVWTAITSLIDQTGAEDDYISVRDVSRTELAGHPWSLQGGGARFTRQRIEEASAQRLEQAIQVIGRTAHTGEDKVYVVPRMSPTAQRAPHAVPFIEGGVVRDYMLSTDVVALFPYSAWGGDRADLTEVEDRHFWRYRTVLRRRLNFGQTNEERRLPWQQYTMFFPQRFRTPLSLAFAFVATHNHFVLDRGGKVFNRSAPVIKLPEGASEDEHLALLGLLNSSAACFRMKQVFHQKGGGLQSGGGEADQPWSWSHEFDGTKLQRFPVPVGAPLERAREMDRLAREMSASLPGAVAEREVPARAALDVARERVAELRGRMIALQEELDWECYRHYGLVEDDLTLPDRLPLLAKGERAFEIVLARRLESGAARSAWFVRHGSTPRPALPTEWPEYYRDRVERRIALIERDPSLNLIERPEYKRRWKTPEWQYLERDALRGWLLNRLEGPDLWRDPQLTTTARLAERLRGDADVLAVAQALEGRLDVDLPEVVRHLLAGDSVAFLAAYRHTPDGLRTRSIWETVWAQQRQEDAIDARDDLDDAEKAAEKRRTVGTIPVPPKYGKKDFADLDTWRLRDELDVPMEQFIKYPGTRIGGDTSPVVGWAGWDHLRRAQALAAHYGARKEAGADIAAELTPLLAGLAELVPWLLQWHNQHDPVHGQRLGDFFASYVDTESRALGLTADQLAAWRPPPSHRGRRPRAQAAP